MARKTLKGIRVGVLAADGFEQVELTIPMRALRKRGAQVDIISLHRGRIRGMNLLWPGKKIPVDELVKEVQPTDFDALLIPGGFVNPDFLRQSEEVLQFVREFDRHGRPIATLCHGPWVLVSAGLASGRKLAAWPGIKDDIRNAGAEWVDEPGVRDDRWFSSRSPLDMRHFIKGMVELFDEHAPRNHPVEERPRWGRWLFAALLGLVAIRPIRTALAR
ncbi:type 1 glutamine amidotransferase domain-containing protein [Vitiosangium sp. GDMCC 1.1324]|uniref:type 1 glutamine amidotransferase domain-containing protein n=1 Tax=Vitiosangium sp. (strain GDMCC 1.1324) TaxID=2138576 RepID=UPI000D33F9A5|nr:type 1 glutamine amidotransferase domain-containing protein [Vitiosangium sp. GDMCC 1.1324]PTL84024.1 type 1 glutamine amidotransferase [Vitiosangium sp. GDMCC 1.1324]